MQRLYFWCAAGLLLLFAVPGLAQPFGKTVIAGYGHGDLSLALEQSNQVERELNGRRVHVISMHDARDRFLSRSHPPQSPSGSDVEALARQARETVEHVALGRTAAAQRGVHDIIALAERSLESLNRETKTARQLLDACLALVRLSVHSGKRDLAIEQAMGCRRLVPDLAPSESTHPANVVGVLAEADDQLRRMRVGTLHVKDRMERACSVYVNGRHLGTTPFTLDQASVGEYRVQVECAPERAGRVHVVHLSDAPVELTVDTLFDETIVTEPRLGLRYASDNLARAHLMDHAQLLGREVRADDVIVVSSHGQRDTLIRVNVRHQRLVAAVAIQREADAHLSTKQVAEAVDVLSEGRFVGFTVEDLRPQPESSLAPARVAAVAVSEDQPPAQPQQSRSSQSEKRAKPLYKQWWLWTAVGVVVAAGITTGVVLATRKDERQELPVLVDDELVSGRRIAW